MVRKSFFVLFIGMVLACFISLGSYVKADEKVYTISQGHSIRIDKNVGDWVGLAPIKDNTACVDKGEYIWKDAKNDDKGAGNYTYPMNEELKKGSDIREFRVTYDDKKLYLMIKCDRPNQWWVPYRVIGIDQDGAEGGTGGNVVLAQGDIDELDTYNGCYAELKVAKELACEYVIAASSTWKARIWDENGRLVSFIEGDEKKVPGFKIADANWYAMEISLPYDIIGDPRGKTWRFIVGVCSQDNDIAREIYEETTEWHGGGGEEPTQLEDGVDPDVYDLVGASEEKQLEDLNSYKKNGMPGNTDAFCTIKNSYIAVKFGD